MRENILLLCKCQATTKSLLVLQTSDGLPALPYYPCCFFCKYILASYSFRAAILFWSK